MKDSKPQYLIIENSLYEINKDGTLSLCMAIALEDSRRRLRIKHTSACATESITSVPRGGSGNENSKKR
jgi:hypothetical protein